MLTLNEAATPLQRYFEQLLELDDIRTQATRLVRAEFEFRADCEMTPNPEASIVVMRLRVPTTELREAIEAFARWLVGGSYTSNWSASWNLALFESTEALSALMNEAQGFNKFRPEVTDQVAASLDFEDVAVWETNALARLGHESERLPMGSDDQQRQHLKQWESNGYEPDYSILAFANPSPSVWTEFLSGAVSANGGYGVMNTGDATSDLLSMSYSDKSRLDVVPGTRLNFNLRYMTVFEYGIDVDRTVPVRVVIDQATASKEATQELARAYIERGGSIQWATTDTECFAGFWQLFVTRHHRQLQVADLSAEPPEVDMISGPYWFVEAIN